MTQGHPFAATLLGILDGLPGGVSLVDADLRYLYINRTLASWHARPAEAIIGRRLEDILPGSALAELRPKIDKVLAGTAVSLEERLTYPDGETRLVQIDYRPQLDAAGKVWGFVSLVNDVTWRHEAEAALRLSEARYREAERIGGLGHWRWVGGPDHHWAGGRNYLSAGARTIFDMGPPTDGFPTEALLVRDVHPDDQDVLAAFYETVERGRLPGYAAEYRLVRPDGSVRHVREVAENMFDAAGRYVEAFGTVLDITSLKETENRLREREAHHRQAERLARLGHWRWIAGPDRDWSGGTYVISDSAAAIFGLPAADLAGSTERLIELTAHPDDRATLRRFFATVQSERQRDYTVDYRLLRPDGSILCVRESAENVFDAAGGMIESFGIIQDITEQRRYEQALRDGQTLLEIGQRLANMGSFDWDLVTGRIRWSDQMWLIHGLERQEFAPSIADNLALIHVADRPLFSDSVARLTATGAPYEIDFRIIRADGEIRLLHEIGAAVLDDAGRPQRAFGSTQDVTELRRAEAALQESEGRLREAQRLARMGNWEWRFADNAVLRSEGYARLFGMEVGDFPRRRGACLDFVHTEDKERLARALDAAPRLGGAREIDFRIIRADGAERILHELWVVHEDGDGGPARMTGIAQDVTEQRQLEHELNQARLAADLASLRKSAYLANMSHELRTPLNAIIGFSDLLGHGIAGALSAKQNEYIGDIHGAAQHLKDVINDVLDLAKIEAGQFELDERVLAIGGVITHCLDLLRYQAQAKRLDLTAMIEPGLPLLQADELAIKKILVNLLSNAVKFTPEGGAVGVTAGLAAGGELFVQVRDTGIGIAENDMERVLQPFSQAQGARARRHEGTGLGLAIALALARKHGGALDLVSAPGQGTTVTLHLPSWRLL